MANPSSSRPALKARRITLQSDALPFALRARVWARRYLWLDRNTNPSDNVARLPFKKVIKFNATWSEVDAMEFVRGHTTVPVPKIHEVYEKPGGDGVHIVMDEVPGDGTDYADMTPDQVRAYGEELAGYLHQLRSLEPPGRGFVGSVTGGSLSDHRLGHLRFGPFQNVEDFHSYLRLGGALDLWQYDPVVKAVHGRSASYGVKFTHADLNPTNIQYHKGRITGIIDWECAGWYPEYWEYTKMWYIDRPAFRSFFHAVEGHPAIGKYPEELEAERDMRRRVSPWAYDDYYGDPEPAAAFYGSINVA